MRSLPRSAIRSAPGSGADAVVITAARAATRAVRLAAQPVVREPGACGLDRGDRERSACNECECDEAAAERMSLCPPARPVGEGEPAELRKVCQHVRADDDQEDREARGVDGVEIMRMPAGEDEADAASEERDRGADDERRDAAQEGPRRAFGPVGGIA